MTPILTFDNVSKVFYTKTQQTIALDKLSFEVNRGEFVAIIGPSGCGKTTILSLISGLIQCSSGKITKPSDNNAIGYMLQHDHLFGWRNIMSNITLSLELNHQMTAEKLAYVNDLITKYGLADFVKHYPNQLSGGMRQRVALIRTLAMSPQLLLLDEPFSALDFQTRLNVCDDVYNIIKKENKTALFVTHDISEAISLADKVLVLTERPSRVLATHYTNLSHIDTPLARRESSDFGRQFELLHKLLNGGTL